jgi:DNA modification methylase
MSKNLFGDEVAANADGGALAKEFLLPPFSVLSARDGWWQGRKSQWIAMGIKSELGRGASLTITGGVGATEDGLNHYRDGSKADAVTFGSGGPGDLSRGFKQRANHAAPGGGAMPSTSYGKDGSRGRGDGKAIAGTAKAGGPVPGGAGTTSAYMFRQPEGGFDAGPEAQEEGTGTSIFDPVLCELAYRWFCPPAGTIIDPFAGGSVRGIVAGYLGYSYHGVELRGEQVAANREQAEKIRTDVRPYWYQGDSRNAVDILQPNGAEWEGAPSFDFLFSCPPYGDLERYSDDPRDLSTLDYAQFRGGYEDIIKAAAALLKPNRFAAFVVGDFRDKHGYYRAFPSHTIEAFEAAGLRYYNEAILVTAVGSLPVRTRRQWTVGRKLGKTHQQLLVFVKGDWRAAATACNGEPPQPSTAPIVIDTAPTLAEQIADDIDRERFDSPTLGDLQSPAAARIATGDLDLF